MPDEECNGGLMLTRKEGQVILIYVGEIKIKVTVTEIHKSQVKIRVGGPRDKVSIHREEVADRYERNK